MTVGPNFKIVVPSYDCADWIGLCLSSIERQTCRRYDVCVIDDASTDSGHTEIVHEYCRRNGWKAVRSPANCGGLVSMIKGIAALECEENDVVVEVDGDDWLYDESVLEYVSDIYRTEDTLMTYGQCIQASDGTVRPLCAVPKKLRNKYSDILHLHTFRHILWRHLRDETLRDPSGHYLRTSWDIAAYYAMAEMAGKYLRFVPKVLYAYNDITGLNDSHLRGADQRAMYEWARSQAPYKPIRWRPEKEASHSTAGSKK